MYPWCTPQQTPSTSTLQIIRRMTSRMNLLGRNPYRRFGPTISRCLTIAPPLRQLSQLFVEKTYRPACLRESSGFASFHTRTSGTRFHFPGTVQNRPWTLRQPFFFGAILVYWPTSRSQRGRYYYRGKYSTAAPMERYGLRRAVENSARVPERPG